MGDLGVFSLVFRFQGRNAFRILVKATFQAVVDSSGGYLYVYDRRKKKSQWHVPQIAQLSRLDKIEQGCVAPPNRRGNPSYCIVIPFCALVSVWNHVKMGVVLVVVLRVCDGFGHGAAFVDFDFGRRLFHNLIMFATTCMLN